MNMASITNLPSGLVTLTFTLLIQTTTADSIWDLHIDNGPTPPPDQMPPFSRNASRDRSLLKYQIPGIIGGYVGFALLMLFALLTIGRRLRRQAQQNAGAQRWPGVEMGRMAKKHVEDISPIEASQGARGWRKWASPVIGSAGSTKSPQVSSTESPQVLSSHVFDSEIIEDDRLRRQQEMEKIYAEVVALGTKAPRTVLKTKEGDFEMVPPKHSGQQQQHQRGFVPPELAHLDTTVEPLHPAYAPTPSDTTAASPSFESIMTLTTSSKGPTPVDFELVSRHSQYSNSPPNRMGRKRSSLRINTTAPRGEQPNSANTEDRMDSSITQSAVEDRAQTVSSTTSQQPLTPFPKFFKQQHSVNEQGDEETISPIAGIINSYRDTYHNRESVDQPGPLPSTSSQRGFQNFSPFSTTPPRFQITATASSSTRTLPLRMPSPPQHQQQHAAAAPTPTRTTFLTPRQDRFQYRGHHPSHFHSDLSPGGRWQLPGGMTPSQMPSARLFAAGLATPYSPYMPFSPVTPVTPGLRTREERKRNEREEGRRELTEEDAVIDEDEMWGNGYR